MSTNNTNVDENKPENYTNTAKLKQDMLNTSLVILGLIQGKNLSAGTKADMAKLIFFLLFHLQKKVLQLKR